MNSFENAIKIVCKKHNITKNEILKNLTWLKVAMEAE
jgi:hypothetical protein